MGGVNFRMNTVFKWNIAAWFLLGIPAVLTAGRFLSASRIIPPLSKARAALLCVLAIAALFAAPYLLSPMVGGGGGGYTLDGLAYLSGYHPGDAAAVSFLRSLPAGDDIIVEAEGPPYSYYARIACLPASRQSSAGRTMRGGGGRISPPAQATSVPSTRTRGRHAP